MNALEKALQTNPTPLLLYAALKDFSGENISFLNHVREWKTTWNASSDHFTVLKKPQVKKLEGDFLRRQQFDKAVRIYASFVGVEYSDFPINLSSTHRNELGILFDSATSLVSAHVHDNSATPFDDLEGSSWPDVASLASTCNSTEEIIPRQGARSTGSHNSVGLVYLDPRLPADVTIPATFGPHAFDHAEESIKYMVLTNTWPKFVTAGYASSAEHKTILNRMKDNMLPWMENVVHR